MGTGVDGCYRSGGPEVPDGHRTDEPARLPDGAGARLALGEEPLHDIPAPRKPGIRHGRVSQSPEGSHRRPASKIPDVVRKRIETGLAGHGEKDRAGVGRCHVASESTPHITKWK
jgi:hypothetical protein